MKSPPNQTFNDFNSFAPFALVIFAIFCNCFIRSPKSTIHCITVKPFGMVYLNADECFSIRVRFDRSLRNDWDLRIYKHEGVSITTKCINILKNLDIYHKNWDYFKLFKLILLTSYLPRTLLNQRKENAYLFHGLGIIPLTKVSINNLRSLVCFRLPSHTSRISFKSCRMSFSNFTPRLTSLSKNLNRGSLMFSFVRFIVSIF